MLKFVHQNSTLSNVEANLGFQFTLVNELVRIKEDDLNEYLHFPRNNLIDDPTSEEILTLCQGIRATLENNKIPPYFNKNHLPNDWNLFFTILSYVLCPKIGGWHGITVLFQKICLGIAHNLNVNYGHMIIERILEHIKLGATHCIYPKFLQIVLNGN